MNTRSRRQSWNARESKAVCVPRRSPFGGEALSVRHINPRSCPELSASRRGKLALQEGFSCCGVDPRHVPRYLSTNG